MQPTLVRAIRSKMAAMQVSLVLCLAFALAMSFNFSGRHIIHVSERQDLAICKYEVQIDHDPNRVPDRIEKVVCRDDGCRCREIGDYRCIQLYTKMNVSYGWLTGYHREFEVLDVEQTCVCARNPGGNSLQMIKADIV